MTHAFHNSNPNAFDSNCSVCGGKDRDSVHSPHNRKLRTIRVNWSNGDSTMTSINGTNDEIEAYYLGKEFNIGSGENDLLVHAVSIEFLD